MIFIPLHYEETPELHQLMEWEGIEKDDYMFGSFGLWVVKNDERKIMGLVSIRNEHKLPSIQYFYLFKEFRNIEVARFMIKSLRALIKDMGFPLMIVNANVEYMKRVIEYYFKKKPYAKVGNRFYYLVEV